MGASCSGGTTASRGLLWGIRRPGKITLSQSKQPWAARLRHLCARNIWLPMLASHRQVSSWPVDSLPPTMWCHALYLSLRCRGRRHHLRIRQRSRSCPPSHQAKASVSTSWRSHLHLAPRCLRGNAAAPQIRSGPSRAARSPGSASARLPCPTAASKFSRAMARPRSSSLQSGRISSMAVGASDWEQTRRHFRQISSPPSPSAQQPTSPSNGETRLAVGHRSCRTHSLCEFAAESPCSNRTAARPRATA